MFVLDMFVEITHCREACSTECAGNSYHNMVHFNVIIDICSFLIVVIAFETFPNFTIRLSLNLNHL